MNRARRKEIRDIMEQLYETEAKLADAYLKIPMLGQVESLNAAIAATLLSYEVARQRRNQK